MGRLTRAALGLSLLLQCFFVAAIEFPLPETNFEPAKMSMHLVYPRPDTETQVHARHRWAHPQMRYEIPVGIQGGAWPFKYELIEAPTGAAIGSLYGDNNYGVVTWTPPSSGTHTFKVRVTDQELNTIDVTWQSTVDADKFLFIQDGWAGEKVGTIDKPLEDLSDWYKGDQSDDTYHNKIVVLRDGQYTMIGSAASNNNVRLDSSSKTQSLIGFPDEIPVVDSSNAKIFGDSAGSNDIFIGGIRFEHSRQDVNNAHFFWMVGDVNRATWWNNYFYDHGPGQVGNDNTTAVFISNKDNPKQYVLYKHNTHDEFRNSGGNGSYIDIYGTSYVLIEENVAKNSTTDNGFWMKGTTAFVTVRANEAWDNISGGQMTIGYGNESVSLTHDHEVCWNRIKLDSGSGSNSLLFAMSNAYGGQTYNSFIYRNTFVNGKAWVRFPGKENYKVDSNIVISNDLAKWDTGIMTTVNSNITGSTSSGIVDDNGLLTGQYRQDHLGLKGHEISDAEVKRPKKPESVIVQ